MVNKQNKDLKRKMKRKQQKEDAENRELYLKLIQKCAFLPKPPITKDKTTNIIFHDNNDVLNFLRR